MGIRATRRIFQRRSGLVDRHEAGPERRHGNDPAYVRRQAHQPPRVSTGYDRCSDIPARTARHTHRRKEHRHARPDLRLYQRGPQVSETRRPEVFLMTPRKSINWTIPSEAGRLAAIREV